MMEPLNVCIAGASRGIGEAIARSFAADGASVLLLARSESVLALADELSPHSPALAKRCDVSCWEDVQSAIEAGREHFGRIDVLVNTAAVLGPTGVLWSTDPAQWAATMNANLIGSYHTMRAVLPHMIEARRGKVINFAGGGAAYAYPNFTAYGASKAAIVRLTETVAVEAAPFNVQANVIAPGAIETEMLQAVRRAGGEVRTTATMDQPVALVRYLASAASDHITGRFIHAKDDYRDWPQAMPADSYTLRRVTQ
ncbi:MAG: SDR family oxidoreductase [Bryobacteraceae bacterium]|nr:SDR family oxidoreductase [Bryobacteraceae bacterium]